jgi:SAM-dependent methyltransferase
MQKTMNNNINTRSYWDDRFSSGDWDEKSGRWQTENFARCQIPHFQIPNEFEGTMLDFGCGLGDAIPVYKEHFPKARLLGVDLSQSGIDKCRERYGAMASFVQGDHQSVSPADIIITSNVMEHLTNDRDVAASLLSKCKTLYIIVPYKEHPLHFEHVNTYDEHYFRDIGSYNYTIYPCIGWSQYGVKDLWYQVYLKNVVRAFLRKPLRIREKQIIFHFSDTAR